MSQLSLHSPLGAITLFEEDGAIVALEWGRGAPAAGRVAGEPAAVLRQAGVLLQDYFDGRPAAFDPLPLAPHGTPFQRRVWEALRRIPPGETRTYGEIGREVGCTAARAIGQANAVNPIPILIPCHRVVAAGGRLGGYSGADGPATKRYLLDLERRARPRGVAGLTEQGILT